MKMSIEIRKVFNDPDSYLKATATVVFDDCFAVKNIRIIKTPEKIFISMPSYRNRRDGRWRDNCHPINAEYRQEMFEAVMEAYEDYIAIADDEE